MNRRQTLLTWIAKTLKVSLQLEPNLVTDEFWQSHNVRPHDRPSHDIRQQYEDSLTAWRKNPLAFRITRITTNYTIGEGITISSHLPPLQEFIDQFWHHPENNIPTRLEEMSEELCRAGDLFPILFRQRQTGVSLLRFLTKDQIHKIEVKDNDWEREIEIQQKTDEPEPKTWVTPWNMRSPRYRAIALHYAINKPIGAQFGESDLATIIPWLLRYSRMLEDRVRFHWATRMFLWFVQVPSNKINTKSEQYRTPPEAGSVIVHDESETWDAKSPLLRGADAAPDLKAVRNMIDAGSGYPPHWRGESADVNLATAQAMQEPTERHLLRRQKYFIWLLMDLTYHAYQRAAEFRPELWPELPTTNYSELFTAQSPDVSRADNERLANATQRIATAISRIHSLYPDSPTFKRIMLKMVLRFAGEPPAENTLDDILNEINDNNHNQNNQHDTTLAAYTNGNHQ